MTEPRTPRRRDPEARRREIIAAATEIVCESGAASLTHRAVAARACVPLGSTTQHFASIDEIREAALQQLADEIDRSLARMNEFIDDVPHNPEPLVEELFMFIADKRSLRADIALMTTAVTDESLRELALRWSDNLIDMLARTLGHERAVAISTYYDGVTLHAGLHEQPLDKATITRTLRALMSMPTANDLPGRGPA